MDKKKVLMVHNFYQIGGGEHTVFKNEVELLRENGHEVIEYTRSNDELKTSKLKMVLLPLTTIWSWKTFWEVRRIIKKEKIDIVHCHNTFPLISPSVYYAARSMKVPVIQTIHNFRLLCPNGSFFCDGKVCEKCYEKNSFKDAIKNNCYRNSKIQTLVVVAMLKFHRWIGTYRKISYIFLTDFNRRKFDKLIDINSDQVFVKPNFVKEPSIKMSPTKCKQFVYAGRLEENKGIISLIDEYSFIYAGRLEKSKGILTLTKMWKTIPNKYHLHIYGDGPIKEEVLKYVRNTENINYHGFVTKQVLEEAYKNSTALIISSECYETFGMGIPESFSLGTPVIATSIGNPGAMILESNAGLIYEIDDTNSLLNSLNRIVNNRDTYSKNAIKYFKKNLNEKVNYGEMIEIYDKTRTIT